MADEKIRIVISAIDKTKSGLGTVTRGLRSVTSAVFSMRGAIATLVGAGGIGLIVKQSLTATDALAKTAGKIGTTTEALSKLQYAAQLSGLSIEQTNMALQRVVRRTAEAARGTGEAQGALRELGVDAKALSQLPLDLAMLHLSDAFSEVDDGAQQLRLAFKLFDSEGAGFVNLLSKGKEAMAAMYGQAQIMGAVMSSSVAKSVEQTNDAFTRLGYLFRGVRDQLVGALAPALEALVTKMTNFFIGLSLAEGGVKAWAESIAKSALEAIATFVGGLGTAITKMTEFANNFIILTNAMGTFFSDDFKEIPQFTLDFADGFKDAAEKIREFASAIGAAAPNVIDINSGVAETAKSFTSITEAIQGAILAMPTLEQSMQRLANGAMASVTQGLFDAVSGAKSFGAAIKDMAKSVVDSLIQMLIQYYITKPLFDALQMGLGGAPTGGGGGGGGKAIGGSVQAGKPYMVGERGTELFVPNQSGSIVPNGNLGGGGGVVVNQTINLSTGVTQTVRAEVLNLMPQIAQSAKAAVAEGRMRGGSYSKALVGA